MAKLLGLDVLTDHTPLTELLEGPIMASGGERAQRLVESMYPGLLAAVLQGIREVESKNVRATTLVYFNFRVQVWGLGFNCDPSQLYKVLPPDIMSETLRRDA